MCCTAQRKGCPVLPPSECCWLVNAGPPNYHQWVGLNYGPIFRSLWSKVYQITSADAEEIIICNAVCDCRHLVPFRRYSWLKLRSHPKSHERSMFSAPNFFWVQDPQILDLVFKTAPISNHVAKFRNDRPIDRGDLALNKKGKRKRLLQNTRARALHY